MFGSALWELTRDSTLKYEDSRRFSFTLSDYGKQVMEYHFEDFDQQYFEVVLNGHEIKIYCKKCNSCFESNHIWSPFWGVSQLIFNLKHEPEPIFWPNPCKDCGEKFCMYCVYAERSKRCLECYKKHFKKEIQFPQFPREISDMIIDYVDFRDHIIEWNVNEMVKN